MAFVARVRDGDGEGRGGEGGGKGDGEALVGSVLVRAGVDWNAANRMLWVVGEDGFKGGGVWGGGVGDGEVFGGVGGGRGGRFLGLAWRHDLVVLFGF